MNNYKLTYFDMDGGRAEPIRIALHAAGIEFEDKRIGFPEFMEQSPGFPFRAVPTLEIDGNVVTQSNAMSRYAGKLASLYPDDDLQALYCDEAMGVVEDLLHTITPTLMMEGDELKAAREALLEGKLSVYLKGLNKLVERGGKYLADNRLTIADLKVVPVVQWLQSGTLEHIPADTVDKLAPALVQHMLRIVEEPIVTAYYASRS